MSRKLIVADLGSARRARSAHRENPLPAAPTRPVPRPLRGLIFDFGGVLYDDTVWGRWLLRLLSHLGMRAHYRSFFHVLEHEYMVQVYTGRATFCEALSQFLASAGLSSGQIDEVLAACHGRRRALEESTRPLPGVRCTLARLQKQGLKLGLLSDSDLSSDEIRGQLDRFATNDTFCSVVSSFDVGCTKPTPICYQRTLNEMGLAGREVAYVGHDPAELQGARRLGMATIAFNAPGETVADVHIDRFEQLAEVAVPVRELAAAG